jgi:hypothetical protein
MKALISEVWTALAMAMLAWAAFALITNESVVDDWLVSVAQDAASESSQDADDGSAVKVGVILIDDDALRSAVGQPNIATSDDRIASAYRDITRRLLDVIQSDLRARAVMLDFYASPYTVIDASEPIAQTNCRVPIVQIALPPPSPFGQEFVRPDTRFIDPGAPCAILAYSFANQAAEQSKLRTIDHNPFPGSSGCPVISLSATAVALSKNVDELGAKLSGYECQRQEAVLRSCMADTACHQSLLGRAALTAPPDDLSVRFANDFFDPDLSADATAWLNNRLVFIGSSNSQTDDYFYLADGSLGEALSLTSQPVGIRWPGVILHAGLAERMLDAGRVGGKTVQFLGRTLSLLLGLAVAALTTMILRKRLSPFGIRHGSQWVLLTIGGLILTSVLLAMFTALVVHFIYALVGVAMVGAGIRIRSGGASAHHSD